MRYRYLQTRGALNETGSALAGRSARSASNAAWRGRQIPAEVLELIPESLARENMAVPISVEGETVTVATLDPDDIALADKLTFVLARNVRLVPASAAEISEFVDRYYGEAGGVSEHGRRA
jgi:type II secretory ATPase GspE/PulE/Tfp pilus assembly ATPase PilB-like protein